LILFDFGGQGGNMGNRPDFESNKGTMTQPQNPNMNMEISLQQL